MNSQYSRRTGKRGLGIYGIIFLSMVFHARSQCTYNLSSPASIIFALENSANVTVQHFRHGKAFIKDIVQHKTMIGPSHDHGNSRLAVLTFARNTSLVVDTFGDEEGVYLCELLAPTGLLAKGVGYQGTGEKDIVGMYTEIESY